MSWQRYDPDAPRYDDPQLTVYSNLSGYINAAADYKWFSGFDSIDVHVDPERDLLALEPYEGSVGTLKISRENSTGADVSIRPPIQHDLGIDPDDVAESIHVPIEWDDDNGWAVVDLSRLRDGEGTDHTPTNGGSRGDDANTGPRWCGTCAKRCASARGVAVHNSKQDDHPEDPVILEEEPDEQDTTDAGETNSESGVESDTDEDESDTDETVVDDEDGDAAVPEPDDAPSVETIRDCAEQVDTLSELAELLSKGVGETRLLAREADVLTEIDDDRRRMGAPNDD